MDYMDYKDKEKIKSEFKESLRSFIEHIAGSISTEDGEWTVKGFIDLYKNIYTISADTKIVSKILEIHLFPFILKFAEDSSYKIVLAKHQNYYPDMSFISEKDENIKFAVDFKTTYRDPKNKDWCNGFTLGSHGEYFKNRESTKNIQFPYKSYLGHYCLGVIYDRNESATMDETKIYKLQELQSITSVIKNFQFFVAEKWKIASDRSGSGNTANIGSINYIPDILNEKGVFSELGEDLFDDYWINYRKINVKTKNGKFRPISNIEDFLRYKKKEEDIPKIVKKKYNKWEGK